MNRLTTSIAMCTYNGVRYLDEQLLSFAAQSVLPDELVIFDDRSSDRTLEILGKFAANCAFPVRVSENERTLGSTRNFEKAIKACRGDIIFLADQDDVWKAHKVERSLAVLSQNPDADYVFSDAELIDGQGQQAGSSLWQFDTELTAAGQEFNDRTQLDLLLKRNLITGATMAFRSSLTTIALPIPFRWIHDYWIALLGSIVSRGILVREPLMSYRVHGRQQLGIPRWNLWHKCTRSLPDSVEDYRLRLQDFRELENRLLSMARPRRCPEARLDTVHQKVLHLGARVRSHEHGGLAQVKGVIDEAWTGRYGRFSNSWRSVLRDLCPAPAARFLDSMTTRSAQ